MKNAKKMVLASLLVAALLLIAGCARQQSAVCGDNICAATESCACDDCKNQKKCKAVAVIGTCDDKNDCTDDAFNELTRQCEHETIENCCGNGKCEAEEHCNFKTYETGCQKDCSLECPAKIEISKFECISENCRKLSENTFFLYSPSPSSAIKATLTNIGERASGNLNSGFKCDAGLSGTVSGDNAKIKGVTFKDYFILKGDIAAETTAVNSRISKIGNKVDYNVNFGINNEAPFNIDCTAIIQDGVNVDFSEKISLYFGGPRDKTSL